MVAVLEVLVCEVLDVVVAVVGAGGGEGGGGAGGGLVVLATVELAVVVVVVTAPVRIVTAGCGEVTPPPLANCDADT